MAIQLVTGLEYDYLQRLYTDALDCYKKDKHYKDYKGWYQGFMVDSRYRYYGLTPFNIPSEMSKGLYIPKNIDNYEKNYVFITKDSFYEVLEISLNNMGFDINNVFAFNVTDYADGKHIKSGIKYKLTNILGQGVKSKINKSLLIEIDDLVERYTIDLYKEYVNPEKLKQEISEIDHNIQELANLLNIAKLDKTKRKIEYELNRLNYLKKIASNHNETNFNLPKGFICSNNYY